MYCLGETCWQEELSKAQVCDKFKPCIVQYNIYPTLISLAASKRVKRLIKRTSLNDLGTKLNTIETWMVKNSIGLNARKPVFVVCGKQRCRPACALARASDFFQDWWAKAQGGWGYSDIFIHTKAQVIFWGSKFWISIFLAVFRTINIFWGMKILWIFFGGHHKIGLYLVVISMHFRLSS